MAPRLPAPGPPCAAALPDGSPPVRPSNAGASAATASAGSSAGVSRAPGGGVPVSLGGLGEAPVYGVDDDLALLEEVPTRFRSLQRNAVADEISSLEHPLDMERVEDRIEEYARFSERLGHHLGAHLVTNYEGFMGGMQHVQQVDLEFSLIRVMIANTRRRLTNASSGIGQGGLFVARQRRRMERLRCVQALALELRELLEERALMEKFVEAEKYHDALRINGRLLHELRSERFEGTGANLFGRLREDLRRQLEDLKQTLRERSMRQAAEAEVDFDAARFEEILEATAASGIRIATASSRGSPSAAYAPAGDASTGYPAVSATEWSGVRGVSHV